MFRAVDYDDYSDSDESENMTSGEIEQLEIEKYTENLEKVMLFRDYLAEYPEYNFIKNILPGDFFHLMEYSMNMKEEELNKVISYLMINDEIRVIFDRIYITLFNYYGSMNMYKFVLNTALCRIVV